MHACSLASLVQGAYSSSDSESAARLIQRLSDGLGGERIGFVQGFYNESLTEGLADARGMGVASYVDIDEDLLSSTMEALEWMFKEGRIVVGTAFGYDNWWSVACVMGAERAAEFMSFGEMRTHKEIAEKWGVKFECACGSCGTTTGDVACTSENLWGAVFVVTEIGSGQGDTGFMDVQEQADWVRRNGRCQDVHERTNLLL